MAFDQRKYIDNWAKENYDRITFRIPKGKKVLLKEIVDKSKNIESVNQLIVDAIEEKYKIDLTTK